jgi:hypothetical protein
VTCAVVRYDVTQSGSGPPWRTGRPQSNRTGPESGHSGDLMSLDDLKSYPYREFRSWREPPRSTLVWLEGRLARPAQRAEAVVGVSSKAVRDFTVGA